MSIQEILFEMKECERATKRKTFKLEELNETFWNNVILVNIQNSSGMGGWGCLWIVTVEPRLYFIGFEGFPYNERKLEEFNPLFNKSSNPEYRYVVEERGWKYIEDRKILIRDDFYELFIKFYKDETKWARGGSHYVHIPEIAAKALGVTELERVNYEVSEKLMDEECIKRKESWLERRKLYITEEDINWQILYPNNQKTMFQLGEYALLFKKHDGEVAGYRFSIVYQREETEPLVWKSLDAIEAYNLFEKKYEKVEGPLYYSEMQVKEITYEVFDEPWITLNQFEINNLGEFMRSFKTLDEAKKYVLDKVNMRQYVNRKNMIKEDSYA